eukprot:TRINITY_DN51317_c0_g1_i1.p1 TRINITY_DN51317_c0_g1~~TRINITY_DN51317_c0_g1_i1.p1  ORF type:complete len:442 (+),score=131.96 TRINITY_DN51317_c0_g1_i1:75-1400(+)
MGRRRAAAVALLLATAPASARRVVAVGDLHGDFHNGVVVLRQAGLVDAEGNWTGGTALLVQMGDLADRGPEPCELYDLFHKLRKQAASAGGEVVTLMGNHEIMNLMGNPKYTHSEVHLERFGGGDGWRKAFHPQNGEYGRMIAADFTAAHQEGHVLFIHAGLLESHAKLGVEGLQRKMRADVAKGHWRSAMTNIAREAPVWTRLQIRDAEHDNCSRVEDALAALNAASTGSEVRRIVVGHTVQRRGVPVSYCGGRLVAMDVAVSGWMPGPEFANLGFLEVDAGAAEVQWSHGGRGKRQGRGLPQGGVAAVRRVALREGPGPWSWSWPRGKKVAPSGEPSPRPSAAPSRPAEQPSQRGRSAAPAPPPRRSGPPLPQPHKGAERLPEAADRDPAAERGAGLGARRRAAAGLLLLAVLLLAAAAAPKRLWLRAGFRRRAQHSED